jgi:K+-sensing histidine kinase KdpD
MRENPGESIGVGAIFGAAIIIVGAALTTVRDQLGSANLALVMVLMVVAAAAAGGRSAGAISAVVASISYNFFFTKPYLTVRIDSGKDILTVVLVLAVGLAVGELGVARSRQSATRRSHLRAVHALEEVGALVSKGADADEAWPAVRHALTVLLSLRGARFQPGTGLDDLPIVERDGRVEVRDRRYTGRGFSLPAGGVMLPLEADGVRLGRIVLDPDPTAGTTREERRAAIALADQFAIALRRTPQRAQS